MENNLFQIAYLCKWWEPGGCDFRPIEKERFMKLDFELKMFLFWTNIKHNIEM